MILFRNHLHTSDAKAMIIRISLGSLRHTVYHLRHRLNKVFLMDQHKLLLLRHGPSYASDIIHQLKQAELLVLEGTLYPLLTRLKNDGLLQYEWQESTQGPPRKYYALSAEGEKFLEGLDAAWAELSSTVSYLKNIHLK